MKEILEPSITKKIGDTIMIILCEIDYHNRQKSRHDSKNDLKQRNNCKVEKTF